jgi:hypothetical protein
MKKKNPKIPIYTADQVFAIAKLLGLVFELYPTVNAEQKAKRSIAFDLEEKFSKKKKQIIKSNSLFETDTLHKMSLKYHEEFALSSIIGDMLEMVTEIKPKNDLRIVLNYLSPKFA